ncbi:flavin monoamine oxidase family protein [Sinomonas humi]|uniref:flavin monoamine oxidase family protein n=1 Tax=Sinomonas humi TaxID=1338436 RepID=UPI000691058D|nr:FAD-dependent oxidoreductase [Sinomonas humi]
MIEDLPRCDVVVIGGGISGLVATTALTRSGLAVRCHEARGRVGGRAHTVAHALGPIDLGATWFWPNEPNVLALARELGLGGFRQEAVGDALLHRQGTAPVRAGGTGGAPSLRFPRGAQSLAAALADRLPHGALHLADPVRAVESLDDGTIVVTADSGTQAARSAIIAVTPALAVEAIEFTPPLPGPTAQVALETAVWMGGTVKAVAVFDEPFWRQRGLSGTAFSSEGPFREFHDMSGPGGSPAALLAFAASDAFVRSDDLETAFRSQLTRLFGPQAGKPVSVLTADWSRDERTSPAAPSPYASTATYGHPVFQNGFAGGRVQWASTETATDYAGHIEGAIRAGSRAAKDIVRLLSPQEVQSTNATTVPIREGGHSRASHPTA